MDCRTPLQPGYELHLKGMTLQIEICLGQGANSIVYRAFYEDEAIPGQFHHVLVKELFPWRPDGGIMRDKAGVIHCEADAEDFSSLHRKSFLRGNKVHLDLQRIRADKVPLNWNTYPANSTLYTVSGDSGGRTLEEILQSSEAPLSLNTISCWMRSLLYSLRAFHEQGLLHLDISPDNILLQPLDHGKPEAMREVLLIDYNSAWRQAELLQREELFLSLKEPYSSPEVRLKVIDSIGPPADLYSVCVIFLTCLSGMPPAAERVEQRIKSLKDIPILQGIPGSALHQVSTILYRGMKGPPRQRYQTADEVIEAFSELIARLEGGGVTKAALWEASVQKFYSTRTRIPVGVELEELALSKKEDLKKLREGDSCLLTGGRGTGKTSMLLSLWMEGTKKYSPDAPVYLYLPLYAYDGKRDYLRRTLLGLLKTSQDETQRTAEYNLIQYLNGPSLNAYLLLDGIDEAAGDTRLLFREIQTLCQRPGVKVIVTARYVVPELGLPVQSVSPLTDEEIIHYLSLRNLSMPDVESVRTLLRTPIFLTIYGRLHPEENELGVEDEEALLTAYLENLVSAFRKNAGEEAGYRGEFAVYVLLPFLASRMKKRYRLTSNMVYQCVERCYTMMGGRKFRKTFPNYVGRIDILRGGAVNAEAWFAQMIRELLERQFTLLWQDSEGNYHLFHQYFQPLLAQRWEKYQRKLNRAQITCFLPLIPAVVLCLILVRGWISAAPKSMDFPRTEQEQQTAELAVNELVFACGVLNEQYQAEQAILDAVTEGLYQNEEGAWATWQKYKDQRLAMVQALEMDLVLPEELLTQLENTPVAVEALEYLYRLPVIHQDTVYQKIDALERCLAPDSGYPEADRRQITKLFALLLESETAESFLRIGQVVSTLSEDAAAPMMEFLSFAGSWRSQLRQVDWDGMDYELGLAACRADQKELKLDLAAFGIIL